MKLQKLLFAGAPDRAKSWAEAFAEMAPSIDFIHLQPDMDLSLFHYCLAWKPEPGLWKEMPALRAVFSLGAGIDALLQDRTLPPNIPIIRMIEPSLTEGMIEYVLWQCLFHHRRMWELIEANVAKEWRPHSYPLTEERVIGIMGLGQIGMEVAKALRRFGFQVRGWSRRKKSEPTIACFAGKEELASFLKDVEILVCLLPLTTETEDILNAATLSALPRGACLINVARGDHLVEEDLIAAMKSGHIAAATLDVFRKEPLPTDHPFWNIQRLFITPHNASLTDPYGAARHVASQIERLESGLVPEGLVDRKAGY